MRLAFPVSGLRFPIFFDPEVAGYVQEHFWHATEQFGTADDGRLLLTMTVATNPELEGKIRNERRMWRS
jgi:hypothetical protein